MGFDHSVAELLLVQTRVQASLGEELLVCTTLDDRAVVDGEDDIGISDRREPVRNRDRGSALDE